MSPDHILLDISRLLSHAKRQVPTGIDRVELTYAEVLARRPAREVSFVARGPLREIVPLPRGVTATVAAIDGAVTPIVTANLDQWFMLHNLRLVTPAGNLPINGP